ncbi:TPA: left-handed beta-roll domain-containing protein [Haemophilus influenzae]
MPRDRILLLLEVNPKPLAIKQLAIAVGNEANASGSNSFAIGAVLRLANI